MDRFQLLTKSFCHPPIDHMQFLDLSFVASLNASYSRENCINLVKYLVKIYAIYAYGQAFKA